MKKQIILFTTLLLALCSWLSFSQIPRTLSYQGVLTDSLGNPKSDGVQTFTFRLYDVESGGAALWTEIKDLQVKRGLFTTILGDITSFPPTVIFDKPYWLGIKPGSEPELSPRIPFSSVAYSLNSLKSDTAAYARVAPQAVYVDSARIAGTIPDNIITSVKILDGTIQRIDVTPTFTAPYSDTAAYARVAPQAGYVDSARVAGTVPDNSITDSKLSNGSVTSTKIPAGQVIKSVNAMYDNITLSATGGATITSSGDTIIINAGSGGSGTGIQGIQNTNNTLDITDPNGPTATINVKNSGITTTQIADNAITATKIASDAVTSAKILDGTIISADIAANAVTTTKIVSDAVTSAKISDGTIQRADVLSTFKAPYADTSDFAKAASGSWNITGNAGTTAGTNFVGTTDEQVFDIRTNNVLRTRITTKGQIETYNTGQSVFVGVGAGANDDLSTNANVFVGYRSGFSNTIGYWNTANGWQAIYSNTTGDTNTANGAAALYLNTTGDANTANGAGALYYNTTGSRNTAYGNLALYTNVAGNNATAIGYNAMFYANNTITPFTNYNVAVGYEALRGSTTASANIGNHNTALGYQTLFSNTTGDFNTAIGRSALFSNTTGNFNTANGDAALYSNTTGNYNTANGRSALYSNTTGYYNTANGDAALYSNTTGNYNTANGGSALFSNTTGYSNTAFGYYAFISGEAYNNSTALGYNTAISASNQVRVGNSSVTSIGGQVGWTTVSDGRFKKYVTESVQGLNFIMKLRPVTYHLDMDGIASFLKTPDSLRLKESETIKGKMLQTGFVAQDVEKAAQELGYDFSGIDKPKNENDYYGLRYAEFTVPLVKAVQEQQKMIEELTKRIEALERK